MKRDGYRCIATGIRDFYDLTVDQHGSEAIYRTQACHIFRRAVAEFDVDDPTNKTVCLLATTFNLCLITLHYHQIQSALSTLDILSHYASLPQGTIEEIISLIDYPSNGFTLECNAHVGFDLFAWSFVEVPDVSCCRWCVQPSLNWNKFDRPQTPTKSSITQFGTVSSATVKGVSSRSEIAAPSIRSYPHLTRSSEVLDPVMLAMRYSK